MKCDPAPATIAMPPRPARPLVAIAIALAIAGCAMGPDYVRQAAPDNNAYGHVPATTPGGSSLTMTQQLQVNHAPDQEWWRAFHSDAIDEAVSDGLKNSPQLAQSQAVLEQARFELKAGEGVFYPALGVRAAAERERVSPLNFGITNASGSVFNLFTLSGSVSYVFDIFGAERRAVEALHAQVDEQRALYAASRLTLCSNIVNASLTAATYQAEADLLGRIIPSQHESLDLLGTQVRAGTATQASLLALQGQVADNEATLPVLRERAAAARHLLALLTGKTPAEGAALPLPDLDHVTLPRELPLSLSSELVRQRPDIVAAEATLHAANAEVGVSTANLFPGISLGGSYGLSNTAFNRLGNPQSRFWSVGPSVEFPLFNGGAQWYQRKAAQAAYRSVLASYRQTVLAAFQQVADTLDAIGYDSQAASSSQEAFDAAGQEDELVRANYEAGLVAYGAVLSADQQMLAAKSNLLQANTLRLEDSVALYAALGGGWQDGDTASTGAQP